MRKLLRGISFIIFLLALVYAYPVWTNNKPVTAPDQAQMQATLENSIRWLEQNRATIVDDSNPMLWRMIQRASDVSGEKRELTRGVYATLCDKEAEQAPVTAARFLGIIPVHQGSPAAAGFLPFGQVAPLFQSGQKLPPYGLPGFDFNRPL